MHSIVAVNSSRKTALQRQDTCRLLEYRSYVSSGTTAYAGPIALLDAQLPEVSMEASSPVFDTLAPLPEGGELLMPTAGGDRGIGHCEPRNLARSVIAESKEGTSPCTVWINQIAPQQRIETLYSFDF